MAIRYTNLGERNFRRSLFYDGGTIQNVVDDWYFDIAPSISNNAINVITSDILTLVIHDYSISYPRNLGERWLTNSLFNTEGLLQDIVTDRYLTFHAIPLNVANALHRQFISILTPSSISNVSLLELGHLAMGQTRFQIIIEPPDISSGEYPKIIWIMRG